MHNYKNEQAKAFQAVVGINNEALLKYQIAILFSAFAHLFLLRTTLLLFHFSCKASPFSKYLQTPLIHFFLYFVYGLRIS